jgi:transglutaminase-like putative cysteine protease
MLRPLSAVLAVILAAPPGAFAAVLKLRAGGEKNVSSVVVEGGSVRLPDGTSLPREAVEEIRFAEAAPAKAAAAAADPAAVARGRALERRAAALETRNPGADGVILAEDDDEELRADGTQVERTRFIGKILKEGLKTTWGQVSSAFEDGRSRVRILKATVYEPDGRVFPLDPSKIQITRPQAESLFFQDYRVADYPLPELEVGSIIEYEVENETYNPFRKDFFFPSWGFQDRSPVAESTLRIVVPKGRPLYYATRNFTGRWKSGAKPRISTKDGRTTYEWRLTDLPAIVSEPDMVQYADISPYVKASLFQKWDRIYDWLQKMYKTRTTPSPALAAFTRKLVAPCKTDDGRVAAIYRYVQKHVRYIAVKMGVASNWGGYDADLTWKRRYGCCIDKAILLTAMLRAIGVRATPVLLDTNYSAVHDFRVPDIDFEHAITHLTLDGKGMFLDSVGEDFRFPQIPAMDHGVKTLDPLDRKVVAIPTLKPAQNAHVYDYDLALSTDGTATADFSAHYAGTFEGDLRGYYKSLKASDLKKSFEDQVEAINPSARLLSYRAENAEDLTKPFLLGWTCLLPGYLVRAGDLYILKLPGFEESFPEVALAKRRYALEYQTSTERRYRYDVTLPPGFAAVSTPKPVRLRGPHESFSMGCKTAGERLTCVADFKRAARVYPVSEYAAHKAFLDRVARLTKDRIFLKKEGA